MVIGFEALSIQTKTDMNEIWKKQSVGILEGIH